jgi:hypothetical protein
MNMRKRSARSLVFRAVRSWIAAWALSCLTTAGAFDVATHAAMTSEALASSRISRDPNASSIFKRLGIVDFPITSDLLDRSLGKNYVYQRGAPSSAAG